MVEELLKTLIGFRTVSRDYAEHRRALAWIKKTLRPLPVFFHAITRDGFPSLLITTSRERSARIWLAAHLDVVDAPERQFTASTVNGRLYGRGAFDMKFALACYMALFLKLGKNLAAYDLGIIITTDEEVGGANGTEMLVKEGLQGTICLLPDNGGSNWEVEKGAKGLWQGTLRSKGVTEHGATPWKGRSALTELREVIADLEKQFPPAPGCCRSTTHEHDTLMIGTMHAGTAHNWVPEQATAGIDIRFVAPHTLASVRAMIQQTLAAFPHTSCHEILTADSYEVDRTHPYVRLFMRQAKAAGAKPRFTLSNGSSDARFLIPGGIPCLLVRPLGGGNHAAHEWISIADLKRFYRVLEAFIEKAGRTDQPTKNSSLASKPVKKRRPTRRANKSKSRV